VHTVGQALERPAGNGHGAAGRGGAA